MKLYRIALTAWFALQSVTLFAVEPNKVDFQGEALPILRKYCVGCHNDVDREGKLSLESYTSIGMGGKQGAVMVPANASSSRLIRVLMGAAEPRMPPRDNEAPREEEVALLAKWIDQGAEGPNGAVTDPTMLVTPKIPLKVALRPSVHAVAISPQGNRLAVARFQEIEVWSLPDRELLYRLAGHRGNINGVAFASDGLTLIASGGEPGLVGEARLWDVPSGTERGVVQGHRDNLYAARISPDAKLLATAGYDQKIKIWDLQTGKEIRTLDGHNGPVFDLAFHPSGHILASASGDRTVKLWDVASGVRLDTLNQALQELYCVAFAPDGRSVAAGGVDNRIRIWSVSATAKEGTNPLRISQFAHELPVLRLSFSRDGRTLASSGEDRLVKIWDTESMTIRATLPLQPDWPVGLAITPDARSVYVGRLDGTAEQYSIPDQPIQTAARAVPADEVPTLVDYGPQPPLEQLTIRDEVEPNDRGESANDFSLPGRVNGKVYSAAGTDHDLFRFRARQGDQWIFETNAARNKSPVDTKLEILDVNGQVVPRVLLRAERDSEVEFRSMDSNQRGVRLKNWEEMYLNEYVYINGEVIKHFQQRRGPDADSQFYPENGSRFAFFETSSRAHALGQPAYVVVPYPVGTVLPNNGLPQFVIPFENDDDGFRKLGRDSRITFVAPADGEYLVRVSDVRGASGEDFQYELIGRRPVANFQVTVSPQNPTVNLGGGKAFTVKAERVDNFMGPIQVEITGVPPGYAVTSPITIQSGMYEAKGVLNALPGAPMPTEENQGQIQMTASAMIAGKLVVQKLPSMGVVKQADAAKVMVHLEVDPANVNSVAAGVPSDPLSVGRAPQVSIQPGSRTTCKLRIERHGFDDRVQLEIENLPHGVIVDDIGLNGILIPEGQTERIIFLACEPWVPESSRLFFAVAKVEGDQVSLPMELHVRSTALAAAP